jgi:hypothetical protein
MTILGTRLHRKAEARSAPTAVGFFAAFFATGCILQLVLVYVYGEYEPKFGPAFSAALGALFALIASTAASVAYTVTLFVLRFRAAIPIRTSFMAGAVGGLLTLVLFDTWIVFVAAITLPALAATVLALQYRFGWRGSVAAAAATLVLAATLDRTDSVRAWRARKAVRYIYWRNFEHFGQYSRPVESLESLNREPVRRWLHGVSDLSRDPWGNPLQYELLDDWHSPHPHRLNWDIRFAVWSNGPNGVDDGHARVDDVDVTNSGL